MYFILCIKKKCYSEGESPGLLKVPEHPGKKMVKGFLYSSWKDFGGAGGALKMKAEMETGA